MEEKVLILLGCQDMPFSLYYLSFTFQISQVKTRNQLMVFKKNESTFTAYISKQFSPSCFYYKTLGAKRKFIVIQRK